MTIVFLYRALTVTLRNTSQGHPFLCFTLSLIISITGIIMEALGGAEIS